MAVMLGAGVGQQIVLRRIDQVRGEGVAGLGEGSLIGRAPQASKTAEASADGGTRMRSPLRSSGRLTG
jgi:hypothetical protein